MCLKNREYLFVALMLTDSLSFLASSLGAIAFILHPWISHRGRTMDR